MFKIYNLKSTKICTQTLIPALSCKLPVKRNARKSIMWIMKHYWKGHKGDNWHFYCVTKDKEGKNKTLFLKRTIDTKIRCHTKIVAQANPFDLFYKDYFVKRESERKRRCKLSNNTKLTGLSIIQPYEGLSRVP